jgi:hypothetical protein
MVSERNPLGTDVLVTWRIPMASVHLSNRLDPGRGFGTSSLRTLSVAGRRLLGVVLLLLGILMTFTLVLLPVGVPLALLAVALIVAPGDY